MTIKVSFDDKQNITYNLDVKSNAVIVSALYDSIQKNKEFMSEGYINDIKNVLNEIQNASYCSK